MKNMYQKIALFFAAWLWTSFCFSAIDYSSLSNNLAEMPGIESTTKGYDLLSGKVAQSVPLVRGSIPFTMKYQASLRLSSDGGVDYYQNLDEGGIADWSNEYSGYIMTNSALPTGMRVFIIQLPGSSEKHIIAFMDGKWKRIYFSGSAHSPAQTFTSENLRDIAVVESGNTISIIKDGVTYTAATSKVLTSFGKSDTLLKFTQIKFQNGRQLNLTYDNGINLIQVKDNRNNTLNILREYKKPGAEGQSYLERKLITGVELISGTDIQRSTIKYQESQVNSIIDPNQIETRYTITDIDSIVAGKIIYQYENQSRGYWLQYVRDNISRKITNAAEGNLPILKRVLDQESNVLIEYEYGNVWEFYQNSNLFLIYSTQITAYSPINGVQNNKSISYYDDTRGIFTNRFVINGQQQTVDITINSANLGNYVNETNLGLMSTATATVTVTGDYPSLVSRSTPIRSVTFNPFTHRIVSMKDFNGNSSNFSYDNLNRLSQQNVAVGSSDLQTTSYNYTTLSDGSFNKYPTPNQIVTDSQTVTNTINPNGFITEQVISYPKGGNSKTIRYSYYMDAAQANFGLVSDVNGPRSDVNDNVSFTYDRFGNKATETQVVNNRTINTKYLNYNSFSQPERIVNPSGGDDQFLYNADGTLQAKITNSGDGNNVKTSYTYDYLKRVKSETNPDNETTKFDYDGLGRLIKTTLPDGSIIAQTFYDNGEIKSIDGASVTYNEINAQGRILKSRVGTDASENWKIFNYDANGNIVQTQTALGIIEKWTYDSLNRNTSYTNGDGKTVNTKSYDKTNNITSSIDAINAGSNSFNYINSMLVKNEINTDYGEKSYTYNDNDQTTNKYHGNRHCEFLGIDTIGRIATINCSSETSSDDAYNYEYTYDSSRFGRLDNVSSNASFGVNTQYSYDNLDRVIKKSQINKAIQTWGGAAFPLQVHYSYTAGNKINSLTTPSGRVIRYNYDRNTGRNSSIDIAGNRYISNISYDNSGNLKGWNIGNTNAKYLIEYTTSRNGLIKSTSFSTKNNILLYNQIYNYDADGRVVLIDMPQESDPYSKQNYSYTLSNQLYDYHGYDDNGNIEIMFQGTEYNGNRLSYIAKSRKRPGFRPSYFNRVYATYLPTGEMSFPNQKDYYFKPFSSEYYANGQMRSVSTNDGQYYMAYNHKNERTIRALNISGSFYNGAIQFVYDESSKLIGEYTTDGIPIVEYVWMGNKPVAAIYGNGNSTKIYSIAVDMNNTPNMLIDNDIDSIVWTWIPLGFGENKPKENSVIKFNLRFPGQYYDELTQLHYNLNRYYSPALTRYIEPDPIGLEGGANPYVYAGNNPISNIDPTGLDFSVINGSYFNTKPNYDSFTSNLLYSVNNFWTFGLWDNYNSWYYDGETGYDPRSSGASVGNIVSMAVTGPGSIVKKGIGVGGTYTVGAYNDLKGTVIGLDAHHVGQKAIMRDLIPGYNADTAPSILVSKFGHTRKGPNGILSKSTSGIFTPRSVIARDIMELRRVYPDIPNSQLQKLIQLNKDTYPNYFKK